MHGKADACPWACWLPDGSRHLATMVTRREASAKGFAPLLLGRRVMALQGALRAGFLSH